MGDFEINEGDVLVLREWGGMQYSGRELRKMVTMVRGWKLADLYWSKEEIDEHGLQVISFE